MRLQKVLWVFAATALALGLFLGGAAAQNTPAAKTVPLTVQAGVPITIALEKPVRIKKVGVPVAGRVVEPVYAFDRLVIPAGSAMEGRVVKIDPVSRARRVRAMANGDFTPFHHATIEFDTLELQDGRRLPIETDVQPGARRVIHLVAGGAKKKKGMVREKAAEARRQIHESKQRAIAEIKAPGKLKRVEGMLSAELPYHRQVLPVGMRFTVELKTPLRLGSGKIARHELDRMGSEIPPSSNVHVWLATPLSSATNQKGSPVVAVVSEPVFTKDHHLILPEGSRLKGQVTKARPARRLGRNGQLRFAFRRVELPQGTTRLVEAGLESADVASTSHIKLDSEGGAHAVSSKKKYLAPAFNVLLATSSLDMGDSGQRSIREGSGDPGDVARGGVRGAAGFGLIGSVLAVAVRSRALSAGFAFYGAAWSVYSHLVARGSEVVFPKGTVMEIRFGSHEGASPPTAVGKRPSAANTVPAKIT